MGAGGFAEDEGVDVAVCECERSLQRQFHSRPERLGSDETHQRRGNGLRGSRADTARDGPRHPSQRKRESHRCHIFPFWKRYRYLRPNLAL